MLAAAGGPTAGQATTKLSGPYPSSGRAAIPARAPCQITIRSRFAVSEKMLPTLAASGVLMSRFEGEVIFRFQAPARPPEAPPTGHVFMSGLTCEVDVVTRDEGVDDTPCGAAGRAVHRAGRLVAEQGQIAAE